MRKAACRAKQLETASTCASADAISVAAKLDAVEDAAVLGFEEFIIKQRQMSVLFVQVK